MTATSKSSISSRHLHVYRVRFLDGRQVEETAYSIIELVDKLRRYRGVSVNADSIVSIFRMHKVH